MVEVSKDVLGWIRKRIEEADVDVLHEMVQEMASALMSG